MKEAQSNNAAAMILQQTIERGEARMDANGEVAVVQERNDVRLLESL
jgi:hypothetical protein